MNTFDFILLTTCDARGERLADLTRLLISVDAEIKTQGLRIRHYLLLQNVPSLPTELSTFLNDQRTFVSVPHRLSLSRARNRMLRQATKDGVFLCATVCAFPDDDAWYPPNSLALILSTFQNQPNIGLLTCDYGSNPALPKQDSETIFKDITGCGHFIRKVSSNTLFLRAEFIETVGFFDERLGVGGLINGGEDLDFALRAYCKAGQRAMIYDGPLVGHRDRLPWVRSQYFAGSLYAIARSAFGNNCLTLQLLRKMAVGAFLVLKRELSVKNYLRGLKLGMGGLFSSQPLVEPFE